jgi:hypothetical protein
MAPTPIKATFERELSLSIMVYIEAINPRDDRGTYDLRHGNCEEDDVDFDAINIYEHVVLWLTAS